MLKFKPKPIIPNPSCAICGKPIKDHTSEEIKTCAYERRKANEATRTKKRINHVHETF